MLYEAPLTQGDYANACFRDVKAQEPLNNGNNQPDFRRIRKRLCSCILDLLTNVINERQRW